MRSLKLEGLTLTTGTTAALAALQMPLLEAVVLDFPHKPNIVGDWSSSSSDEEGEDPGPVQLSVKERRQMLDMWRLWAKALRRTPNLRVWDVNYSRSARAHVSPLG